MSRLCEQKCGLQALCLDTLTKVQVVTDEKDSLVLCMKGRRPIRLLVRQPTSRTQLLYVRMACLSWNT